MSTTVAADAKSHNDGIWAPIGAPPAELRCDVTLVCGQVRFQLEDTEDPRCALRSACIPPCLGRKWLSAVISHTISDPRLQTHVRVQTFRWRVTGEKEWTGVIADTMVSLRQAQPSCHRHFKTGIFNPAPPHVPTPLILGSSTPSTLKPPYPMISHTPYPRPANPKALNTPAPRPGPTGRPRTMFTSAPTTRGGLPVGRHPRVPSSNRSETTFTCTCLSLPCTSRGARRTPSASSSRRDTRDCGCCARTP